MFFVLSSSCGTFCCGMYRLLRVSKRSKLFRSEQSLLQPFPFRRSLTKVTTPTKVENNQLRPRFVQFGAQDVVHCIKEDVCLRWTQEMSRCLLFFETNPAIQLFANCKRDKRIQDTNTFKKAHTKPQCEFWAFISEFICLHRRSEILTDEPN